MKTFTKVFKYNNRPLGSPDLNRQAVQTRVQQETFAGQVQGKKSSDLEERFARAQDKIDIKYAFRVRISPLAYANTQELTRQFRNLPGELEIDFLSYGRSTIPIMVDGFIGHFYTPAQTQTDIEKTYAVNEFGKHFGWHEVVRIPYVDLVTQEMADQKARMVFA